MRFRRDQRQFEREVSAPIVTIAGGRWRIRSSYFTTAPFQLPSERMRIVRDSRHHDRFEIRPGDVLLYDNHRMLHRFRDGDLR